MEQNLDQKQKKKNGLKMSKQEMTNRINNMLSAKLAVRNCQYKIALEGLKSIVEYGDTTVAEKTIEAMLDCLPDNS